jgi:nucleoside-diphosphate-sugar epimerase
MTARGAVLVTGATGFLAGHLVPELARSGRRVVLGARRPVRGSRLPWVDITARPEQLRAGLAVHDVVDCVHLAARFVAEHAPEDVAELVASNIGLSARIADALAASQGARMVTAGTVWQHADGPAYRPVSLYAATKQASQDVLEHYAVNAGVDVRVLKLPDTYGPGDTRRKALDLLLETARSGEPLGMSPGEQLLDLVHARDVARGLLCSLEAEPMPQTRSWALTSGRPLTLRALAARVASVTGRPVPVQWGVRPYRAVEAFAPWQAGKAPPGWAPTTTLEDGIAEMWRRISG